MPARYHVQSPYFSHAQWIIEFDDNGRSTGERALDTERLRANKEGWPRLVLDHTGSSLTVEEYEMGYGYTCTKIWPPDPPPCTDWADYDDFFVALEG